MNSPTDRVPQRFTGFLSHKAADKDTAAQIKEVLERGLRNVNIFVSHEIPSGEEWRERISEILTKADFLILLFTDPADDWSWCFYETGFFEAARTLRLPGVQASGGDERPIFCLHHPSVEPPRPLGHRQCVSTTEFGISQWIRQLRRLTEQPQDEQEARIAAQGIGKALAASRRGVRHTTIKPSITIRPGSPTRDGTGKVLSTNLDPEHWLVDVDQESARMLGLTEELKGVRLLEFLTTLEFGHTGFRPLWQDTFLDSLNEAMTGSLELQDVAYFRHRSGRILRPIIDSVLKNLDGIPVKCRVVFVNAFSAPPGKNPSRLEKLTDSIRLAIRSRTEILSVFAGKMASLHDKQFHKGLREKHNAKKFPIGEQLLQSFHVILQEAEVHDFRVEEAPPVLFADRQQREYERIRQKFTELWAQIQETAREEDSVGFGRYDKTEALLAEFAVLGARYMDIAIPRLKRLLQEQMAELNGRLLWPAAGGNGTEPRTPAPEGAAIVGPPAERLTDRRLEVLVKQWQGRYVCFRSSFADPDVVNAYLMDIRWDEDSGYMVFEERGRKDRIYEQKGELHFHYDKPLVSLLTNPAARAFDDGPGAENGDVRVIMLSPPRDGSARGMMLTVAHPTDGPDFVPASTPVVLRKLRDDEAPPQLGFVDSSSPDYALYRKELLAVVPHFGMFTNMSPVPHGNGEDARPATAARDSVATRAPGAETSGFGGEDARPV